MYKVSFLISVLAMCVFAEPPSREYLPAQRQLSREYLPAQHSLPSREYLPAAKSSPNQQYGPPGYSQNGNGYADSQTEPANYEFHYDVNEDGLEFGHQESRQGDQTQGRYYVLLPDGRMQTVEYTADQDGFHPKISYKDTGRGNNGGYPQGGPY